MAATAASPLTHQLYLEKLVREHHMDRALEYFNQFRFVPTRITMICAILQEPLGPLTTAMLDEGRALISRSRYIAILTQPNIFVDKIAMYVQQMLLKLLLTNADHEEQAEVSQWALKLDTNYFILLKGAGIVVTEAMRKFALDIGTIPARHRVTFLDAELRVVDNPTTTTNQLEIDFANAIPPMPGGKVVVNFDGMSRFSKGTRGHIYRTTVTTAGKVYEIAIKIADSFPESQYEVRKEAKNIRLLHGCNVPNVIPLIDAIFDENARLKIGADTSLPKLALVFPFCGEKTLFDLYKGEWPSLSNVRSCTFELCRTLDGLEKNGFVHNDFVPRNITVPDRSVWKPIVIDWATMECSPGTIVPELPKTTYCWRSPENWLFQRTVDVSSDVWALGSILISLTTNKTIPFYIEQDEPNVMEMITLFAQEIGDPPKEFVDSASNKNKYKPVPVNVNTLGKMQHDAQNGILRKMNDQTVAKHYRDLISRCLMWDPAKRLKPSEALSHPFFVSTATATSKK